MNKVEWLNSLTVGSEVVVRAEHRDTIRKVKRLTDTLIIVEGEHQDLRVKKSDGYQYAAVRGRWSPRIATKRHLFRRRFSRSTDTANTRS